VGLGLIVVLILTVVMLSSYFYGRYVNFRLQKKYWAVLSKAIKEYSRKVNYRSLGSSLFQVSFPGRPPLKRVELTVLLMDREFLTHYIASKLMGKTDEFILKASFTAKPDFTLQIGGKPGEMKRLEQGWVGMEVYTDSRARAVRILGDEKFREAVRGIGDDLFLLVVGRSEPNILVRCSANPDVARLMIRVAHRVSSLVTSKG